MKEGRVETFEMADNMTTIAPKRDMEVFQPLTDGCFIAKDVNIHQKTSRYVHLNQYLRHALIKNQLKFIINRNKASNGVHQAFKKIPTPKREGKRRQQHPKVPFNNSFPEGIEG